MSENHKIVDEQTLVGAKIEQVNFGLPAENRCDRCPAQAYVEIEVYDTKTGKKYPFELCAHHYSENEPDLVLRATRIIDHRPYLHIEEQRFKGLLSST